MAYYDRIKEARLACGLTQEQIAQKIGVAKSTFTGYEKGNREPTMILLGKIMEVLHVDANYIFQDEMQDELFKDELFKEKNSFSNLEQKIIEAYRVASPVLQDAVLDILHIEKPVSTGQKKNA